MYRFRPIRSLLDDFQELENQEIYFAPPEQLNDPMEGYRDVFWKGDKIVWKNLLINYVRCLEFIFTYKLIVGDSREILESDIPILGRRSKSDSIEQICEEFFKNDFINRLPESLGKKGRAVRRNELLTYLRFVHSYAINSVSTVFKQKKILKDKTFKKGVEEFDHLIDKTGDIPDLFDKIEDKHPNTIEKFFTFTNILNSEISLINRLNNGDKAFSSNNAFLLVEFPDHFISELERSIYPEWYSASFLSDCSNSAIWGHYGDNHTGVCLKFRTQKSGEDIVLNLKTEYGYNNSGPTIGMRPHIFRKIKYHKKYIEIDFFRSIARLTKRELKMLWYSDENGNISNCSSHLDNKDDEEQWRDKYWNDFQEGLTIKLKEWSYEKEYRLIVNGNFVDYSDNNRRKLQYEFEDLEAIIFGMKTSIADKARIVKIIGEKCKKNERKQFDFFQAYYSKDSGKIESHKLNLIKFD